MREPDVLLWQTFHWAGTIPVIRRCTSFWQDWTDTPQHARQFVHYGVDSWHRSGPRHKHCLEWWALVTDQKIYWLFRPSCPPISIEYNGAWGDSLGWLTIPIIWCSLYISSNHRNWLLKLNIKVHCPTKVRLSVKSLSEELRPMPCLWSLTPGTGEDVHRPPMRGEGWWHWPMRGEDSDIR